MAKGSCSCGAVNFEYSGEPAAVVSSRLFPAEHNVADTLLAVCHCLPCRKSSAGTHSINIILPEKQLNVSSGNNVLKQWKRSGDSGKEVTNNFCGTCGNLLFVRPAAMDGLVIVKYGMIDEKDVLDNLPPQQEIYCKNLLKWEKPYSTTEKKDAA